ncbi:hypothetical protein KC332_g5498 [Hortaea werneckii]|uniref:F-box domain-containing protein n=2 Tax=Hortaea werneckii TaxID=91943 RepID=A0A3M7I4R1_HORWE|nr:hypothetical protein KC358_g5417 [Hortaea werneckii]OTA31061.1 hypothetical protein BTJ68_09058 [Hortaea werneckii EXF-2000]KAI6845252.1 hypothetical protein KC350_g4541 [Hortaea werneckii]KAI6937784.1 hypothetical protein KC348_g5653 [Hortaea werneckii]KAI6938033.1 hypothetical protein KC341_g5186 [Hortaea werneckii]
MDGAVDQSASALLSLPPELRNEIWRYLLVLHPSSPSSRPNAIDRKEPRHPSPPAGPGLRDLYICANILRTCKQANAEATPILYGENTFNAHPSLLATLPSFLLSTLPVRLVRPPVTHPRVIRLIRKFSLHVRLDTDPRFTSAQAEESFNGVDELEIEVFQAMYGGCDFSVLGLFEGVRAVGRAVVRGSVGDGRYADWLARSMMCPPGEKPLGFAADGLGGGREGRDVWRDGNR